MRNFLGITFGTVGGVMVIVTSFGIMHSCSALFGKEYSKVKMITSKNDKPILCGMYKEETSSINDAFTKTSKDNPLPKLKVLKIATLVVDNWGDDGRIECKRTVVNKGVLTFLDTQTGNIPVSTLGTTNNFWLSDSQRKDLAMVKIANQEPVDQKTQPKSKERATIKKPKRLSILPVRVQQQTMIF